MRIRRTLSLFGYASLTLTGCALLARREMPLPGCNEAPAAALDTTLWRPLPSARYPSLMLPPEFVEDPSLVIICYHGGVMWSDPATRTRSGTTRFIGWCHEDGMPEADAPDTLVRKIPVIPVAKADGELCQLSFPVFGQRMALSRQAIERLGYAWITWPLDHGEPTYLLARSPSASDEAVIIRALRSIRFAR